MVGSIKNKMMMKTKLKSCLLVLALGIVTVSCDYDETNYQELIGDYTGESTYYLQFNEGAQLFETSFDSEGQPTNVEGEVAVKLLGPPQPQDLTIEINLDPSSDLTPEMYDLGSTSLVIPAGQTSASTSLTVFTEMLPVDQTSSLVLSIDEGEHTATAGSVLTYDIFRTAPCIPVPGEYTVVMTDSYGDGWQTTTANGGPGIIVEVDGVQVAEVGLCSPYEATFDSCTDESSRGETTVTIPEGSLFAKWIFPGDNWGEIGYEIYDPNGVLVASANAGQGVAGTIDVQACLEEDNSAEE